MAQGTIIKPKQGQAVQQMPPVANRFVCQQTADGRGMVMLQQITFSVCDPLDMLRSLKANYPEMWQQVNLEIIAPRPVAGQQSPAE